MQCTHGVTSVGGDTTGPARFNSSNVGVSLRARWDAGQVRHTSGTSNVIHFLNIKQQTQSKPKTDGVACAGETVIKYSG